jgi:anaerobic ribonucleoside-triphosphate reductase
MLDDSATTSRTIKNIKKALGYSLQKKYGIEDEALSEKILAIHGLSKKRFDIVNTIETFINSTLNDVSIDANSNKNEVTIEGLHQEAFAPIKKAVGFDYLYRQMKELYGKEEAYRLSGDIYDFSLGLSDSTNILKTYCWSLDASKIVTIGRQFGQLHSNPAKRVSSYISALCESVHQLSSHLAGACAIGSFFLDVSHLSLYKEGYDLRELKTNKDFRKKLENEMQQFVHSVNHLSRSGNESPFSNVSIFDRVKLRTIIADMNWYFPFEEIPIEHPEFDSEDAKQNFYINYIIDYIEEVQNIFLDFFDKGDPLKGGAPYRFPIVTLNIGKKKNGDKEVIEDLQFLKNVCKRDIFRYNIFVSEGNKFASCCFRGDQKVLIRNSKSGELLTSIKEVIQDIPNNGNTSIFHNGFWKKFKKVEVDYHNDWYEIITENGKKLVCTEDHLHPTLKGTKTSIALKEEDYLLFNTINSEKTQKYKELPYEEGYLIGCFLGDGCYLRAKYYLKNDHGGKDVNRKYYGVILSLNNECYDEIYNIISSYVIKKFKAVIVKKFQKNNVVLMEIRSEELAKWMLYYVPHNHAPQKFFNDICFGQCVKFREGIIAGVIATDGVLESKRMYTTSIRLAGQLDCLCTNLGLRTDYSYTDRTGEGKVIIREKKYNRNHALHCIRIYFDNVNRSKDIKFIYHNNSVYFKIKSIKKIKNKEGKAYCFEIKDAFPYFTLPNGIITHNCRLLSSADMLQYASQANSFGAGGSISIGSHRVCTINFPRIVLEATSRDNFYEILENRIESAAKILNAHKKLISKLNDMGLQPFIKNGWINMKRLFSTFGLIGIYEASKMFKEKFGNGEDIEGNMLIAMNSLVSKYSEKYEIFGNIEQIPGESFAIRLLDADKVIFGDKNLPYMLYSNQFIPLWEEATLWEKLDADGKYNKLITGGGIVHAQIGEKVTPKQAEKIIKYAVNSGSEHFALNAIYSECATGHVSFGKFETCPVCSSKIVEKYTRIVGFFTPVSSWQNVRREWEFNNRTFVDINKDK